MMHLYIRKPNFRLSREGVGKPHRDQHSADFFPLLELKKKAAGFQFSNHQYFNDRIADKKKTPLACTFCIPNYYFAMDIPRNS